METSEDISELAAALAKAQGLIEAASKDHTAKVKTESGNYSYAYADLASVWSVCRAPLAANGLSVVQSCRLSSESSVTVLSRLMHLSGQWIESDELTLPAISERKDGKITAQVIGSAITYARRYSLGSLLGVATEADDDGNAGSGQDAETGQREPLPNCPNCGTNQHVIVGKPEYGGGFVCYMKKGGCGEKWQAADVQTKADETKRIKEEKLAALDEAVKKNTHPGIAPIDDRQDSPADSASTFSKACSTIDFATDEKILGQAQRRIVERWREKIITDDEYKQLEKRIADRMAAINPGLTTGDKLSTKRKKQTAA